MSESSSAKRRLGRADRTILAFLREEQAEYPAIVANRTGLHVPYVEKRCEALCERGLLERVTDEVVYRITEAGAAAVGPAE